MEIADFKNTIERLKDTGFSPEPQKVYIKIDNAKEVLMRGITYFARDRATWKKEYEEIASWLSDNQGKGLFVNGSCGLGKTMICGKIIPIILNCMCQKVVKTIDAQTMNDDIDTLKRYKLLMIDDVGIERESVKYGNRRQAFAELVDNAERTGNLLIITSNLNGDEIIQKYGARTADRLGAITKGVEITGESLRY
jgi:DNA replication protein DnaC